MTSEEAKKLCLNLLHADTEDEVIKLLKQEDLWDKRDKWRFLGDREGNYSIVGNQQNRSDAALTEKLVNSIDAMLMGECMSEAIEPTSHEAPQSIRKAVARFFEKGSKNADGNFQNWPKKKRREIANNITVALTGSKKNPSITVADAGEGQTPNKMHDTFLSIDKDNKLKIKFVQGKYNMGGTGVLRFCGNQSLQLIITRRNPKIIEQMTEEDESSSLWGFTVVRREDPDGLLKNSMYSYLAPLDIDNKPRKGEIIKFAADSLPLFPEDNSAYKREMAWGSAVKMYNYEMKGFASHAFMKGQSLHRLEARLPLPALPIRVHECRDFKGQSGSSFDTTLSGLMVRLKDNKGDNLENGFPDKVQFIAENETMHATIFAFKKGKAETYKADQGIIYMDNGQTHAIATKSFFSRNRVLMGRIKDSLLVVVDCSEISSRARERLFMNSRDRLGGGSLQSAVETQLENIIHNHEGLRLLKEKRRQEQISERLEDAKPLEDVLRDILKSSPTLDLKQANCGLRN